MTGAGSIAWLVATGLVGGTSVFLLLVALFGRRK